MSVGCSLNDRNNNPVEFFPPILRDAVEEIEENYRLLRNSLKQLFWLLYHWHAGVIKIRYPDGRVSPSQYITP
jgi:hypothetical protein